MQIPLRPSELDMSKLLVTYIQYHRLVDDITISTAFFFPNEPIIELIKLLLRSSALSGRPYTDSAVFSY